MNFAKFIPIINSGDGCFDTHPRYRQLTLLVGLVLTALVDWNGEAIDARWPVRVVDSLSIPSDVRRVYDLLAVRLGRRAVLLPSFVEISHCSWLLEFN